MRLALMVILSFAFTSMQCHKCFETEVPACIEQKINEIKSQPKWNPPATVSEYEYKGAKVYLFTSDCCDRYIELYNGDCSYICAPSGGISGGGDSKCSEFYSEAKFIREVWKDPR